MRFTSLLPVLAMSLAACGGGGDSGGTNPPPSDVVSTVSLSRTSATMRPAEAITVTATPRNASGAALTGKTVSWTVTQTGTVVNLAPNGASVQITAAAVGTATVTSTVDGKTASIAVTVTNQAFPSTASVTVANNSFTPADVDVALGATVTWTWAQGSVDHNVTFNSGNPASVSAITTRSTGSDSRTFNTAGLYSYVCTIHQGMNGTVIVH